MPPVLARAHGDVGAAIGDRRGVDRRARVAGEHLGRVAAVVVVGEQDRDAATRGAALVEPGPEGSGAGRIAGLGRRDRIDEHERRARHVDRHAGDLLGPAA